MIDTKFAKYLYPSDDENEDMMTISLTTPKAIIDELREADDENYKSYGYHIANFKKYDEEMKKMPRRVLEELRKSDI